MSVISFPRRADTLRPTSRTVRPAAHRAPAPRRDVAVRRWRGTSSARKAATVVVVALALSLTGSMLEANRQIEIHNLQSQLLQD